MINAEDPQAEAFSNSSASQGIYILFDGQDGAIPTYEDKEVYFAVQFREPRAINRMRIKFSHSNRNQWEAWGGERLPDLIYRRPAARRYGKVQELTSGDDWGDQNFADPGVHPLWLIYVKRLDGDHFPHVDEWELYEGGSRLDVLSMLRSARVAGSSLMPFIRSNIVHYNSAREDLMASVAYHLAEYHVWALNTDADWQGRDLPLRRGYYGRYLRLMPNENVLVVSRDGLPAPDARIEVYQQQEGVIPDVPKYTGRTDAQGNWRFPHETTSEYGVYYGHSGSITTPTPFSSVYSDDPEVLGTNTVLVIHVIHPDASEAYRFLDLPSFGLEMARGNTAEGRYQVDATP